MTKSLRRKRQSKDTIEYPEDPPPRKVAKDEVNSASSVVDAGIDQDKVLSTEPELSTLSSTVSTDEHLDHAVDECTSKAQISHVTLVQGQQDSGRDKERDNDTDFQSTIVPTADDITDERNLKHVTSDNTSDRTLKVCESACLKSSNLLIKPQDNATEILLDNEQKQHSNDVTEHDLNKKHEDIDALLTCNKDYKDLATGNCEGLIIANKPGNLHKEECTVKDSSQENDTAENHQEISASCKEDIIQSIQHSISAVDNGDKVACISVGYDKDKTLCTAIKMETTIADTIESSEHLNRSTKDHEEVIELDVTSLTNDNTKSTDISEVESTPTASTSAASSSCLEWEIKGSPLPNMTYNPISADLEPMMVTANDMFKVTGHSSVSSHLTDIDGSGTQPFCTTVPAEGSCAIGRVSSSVQSGADPVFKSPKLATEAKVVTKENHADLPSGHHQADDFDITDSQLCTIGDAISQTALRLPRTVPRPSSSVQDPERVSEGSRIIKTLITEMTQLNKLVMRAKRQIEATRKNRQRPSPTAQANTTTTQTTLAGRKKF